MKKIISFCFVCFISSSVLAGVCQFAPDCHYTIEQQIVRSAENYQEVAALGENFDPNAVYPCGGTLLQLAVIRGRVDVMAYVVNAGADMNQNVSLKGYEIDGAPDEIPFALFAARYSPSSEIIDTMLNSGVSFLVKDEYGRDALWYFEQNPVLRSSYLTKNGLSDLMSASERLERLRREASEED